ncbi:hypothetical protein V8C86DRAFT_2731791 [Haematococcus lacustris]
MPTSHHTTAHYYPEVPDVYDTRYATTPAYAHASTHTAREAPAAVGHVQVAPLTLEPQPWVRDLAQWFSQNTVGIARVDLKRPMPPYPEQYNQNNLLFANYKTQPPLHGGYGAGEQPRRSGWGSLGAWGRGADASKGALSQSLGQGQGRAGESAWPGSWAPPSAPAWPGAASVVEPQFADTPPPLVMRSAAPSGARVKITRSLLWGGDKQQGTRRSPFLDLGAGVNIDMDRQKVEPVLRLKLRGLLSLKAFPLGHIKISKTLPLWGTGMALKLLYEVPLQEVHHFYRPPARLMARLEQSPGSGLHLTPTGLELDQTSLQFGRNISLRASAGLKFPRGLPIEPDNDDFGLKVHRLSLKTLW